MPSLFQKNLDKPGFQLTYLTFTDKEKFLGHSCVGISEVKNDGSKELLFRVGLFPTNQVQVEDFIKNKKGRVFRERSWNISENQMANVLHKINKDRQIIDGFSSKTKRKSESNQSTYSGEKSIPGGPQYDLLCFNCKDYALNVIESAGIETTGLRNSGVNIPLFSGSLKDIKLIEKKNGILEIIEIDKSKSFIEKMLDFISKKINELKTSLTR